MSDLTEQTPPIKRMTAWLAASQAEQFPYEVEVVGHSFTVMEGVFSPRYYPETEFYATHLVRRVRPGQSLLDLGCGIGVNTVLCALGGARVTALDINAAAIKNTLHNAHRHGVSKRVTARRSDIFSAIPEGSTFDTIYWNVPFTNLAADTALTTLEEAVFDPGYRKNQEFVTRAVHYLAPGGEVLMGVSETLGDVSAILAIARRVSLHVEEVARVQEKGTPEATFLQLLRLIPES
jgi:release factor glutamine methyltransferase